MFEFRFWRVMIVALLPCIAVPVLAQEPGFADATVRIDYFFEPSCAECFRVNTEIMPVLQDRYMGFYELHKWDLGVEENYLRLVAEMERLEVTDNARVYMLLNRQTMLTGFARIESELFPWLDEAVSSGAAIPPPAPEVEPAKITDDDLKVRVDGFTLGGVIIGGITDGINPCAISTLVFLISVLSMYKVTGRHLLAVGGVFCLASFLTYSAIGFGLLHALHLLSVFHSLRRAVDYVLSAVLLVLAILSFTDAFRYRATHRADSVTLQLPGKVRDRIHRMMRRGLSRRAQLTSAFGLGCAVTALESVCTGQVYVPTLALVVKRGADVTRGLIYLGIYNLMFIMPLIIVLALTHHGLQLFSLIEWSRRNVTVSKVLLGCFFLALGGLIFFME